MEKSDEEQSVKRKAEKFLKIIKYKRFFSFLSGFLSGKNIFDPNTPLLPIFS